jgi:hypothetical protein
MTFSARHAPRKSFYQAARERFGCHPLRGFSLTFIAQGLQGRECLTTEATSCTRLGNLSVMVAIKCPLANRHAQ